MKKKFWSSEKIVSIAAISISLFTLYIFIKQTNIIERQSRLSTMPYVMMESAQNTEINVFSIDMVNYGVGPAIVESKVIRYKGEEYSGEFHEFLKANFPAMDTINVINWTTFQVGLALPAGSTRNIIRVGGNAEDYYAFLEIMKELTSEGLEYEVKYKSIYDERWKINAEDNVPIQLD